MVAKGKKTVKSKKAVTGKKVAKAKKKVGSKAVSKKKNFISKFAPKKMTMRQLQTKAKNLGINPGTMEKTELIHTIQRTEGFTPCFGTSDGLCTQITCCFRADCLTMKN